MDIEAANSFTISNGTHLSFANLAGRTITVDGFSGGCALNGTPGDSLDLNPASAWTLAVNAGSSLSATFSKIGNCTASGIAGTANTSKDMGGNVNWNFIVPTITATAPLSSSFVNNTKVSYTVSEALASGSITWTRTGGITDANSPYIQALGGVELASGAHTAITLTNNPTLINGAIYTVAFNTTGSCRQQCNNQCQILT